MAFEKNNGLLVHPDSYYWNSRNKHSLKVCNIWDNLPNLFPLNINDILWFFIDIGCDLWNLRAYQKLLRTRRRFFRTRLFPRSYFCAFFFFLHIKRFLRRRTNGSHRTNGDSQHSILRDASKPSTWASRWRRENTDELSTQLHRCWSYSSGQIHWNLTALSSAVPQIPGSKQLWIPLCHGATG